MWVAQTIYQDISLSQSALVGGLEHFLFFHHIGKNESSQLLLTPFFRGVGSTANQSSVLEEKPHAQGARMSRILTL